VSGEPAFTVDHGSTGDGFDERFFADLVRLEEQSFWFRSRNELIAWAIDTCFPQATSMLEVGCGTGFVLQDVRRRRPRMRLAGGDPFASGVALARRRLPGVPIYLMDGRRVPFRDEFDLVGAFDVLEHIAEDDRALAEARAALRPGGGLVVTVPQHPWLWSAADESAHHVRRYTRRGLLAALREAGFEPLRVTSFVSLPLPLLAGSRMLHRRGSADFDPLRELRLPVVVDRTLRGVLALERLAVRHGVSFPAGGSLLAVARRG
jgi:SAM-dependent methyltransferase